MSDALTINRRLDSLDVSPQFQAYSKVIIHIDEEQTVESGNDTGRTLDFTNPFGTQAMANAILSSLSGFKYQPYTATGAILNPAAEVGDGVNMTATYGGIYTRKRKFTSLMKADISAPMDEEIDHEFQFESPQERQFKRQVDDVKASLLIQSDRIEATVSKEGGEASTFGWRLNNDSHRWFANGQEVMSITASGLTVKGNVQADTGTIGGFTITASSLYNNLPYYGAPQSNGVYIGSDGIQLGQGFFVNSSGQCLLNSLTANDATINGTLNVGGNVITAYQLSSGAASAYNNGGYWSGGAGGGYRFDAATQTSATSYPLSFTCGALRLRNGTIRIGNHVFGEQTATIAGTTIHYIGYK